MHYALIGAPMFLFSLLGYLVWRMSFMELLDPNREVAVGTGADDGHQHRRSTRRRGIASAVAWGSVLRTDPASSHTSGQDVEQLGSSIQARDGS